MKSAITLPLSRIACSSLAAVFALTVAAAHAHGGAIEVNEGAARGPVSLSEKQAQALGLQIADADLRPLASLLKLNGQLAALPDAEAAVTVRISGRVSAVYANLGDRVEKGQTLARIETRAVGDPPPQVGVASPMDGVVDERGIVLGQPVEPSSTLFHVSRTEQMRVVARVYEEDLGKLRVGQQVYVHALAYPGQMFKGAVKLISPKLDPDTRTSEVWVILDNAQGLLKPNLFATADVVIGSNHEALAVPNAAILQAQGETFVFVKSGDKYDRKEVELGASDDEYTEVKTELVPGDQVVTQGAREVYTLWLTSGSTSAEK